MVLIILAKNTPNASELTCPICLPKPNSSGFHEKRLQLKKKCPWFSLTIDTYLFKLQSFGIQTPCDVGFLNDKIDQNTNFAKLLSAKWLFCTIVNFIIHELKFWSFDKFFSFFGFQFLCSEVWRIGNLKQNNPALSAKSVSIPTLNLGMLRGQQSMNERA